MNIVNNLLNELNENEILYVLMNSITTKSFESNPCVEILVSKNCIEETTKILHKLGGYKLYVTKQQPMKWKLFDSDSGIIVTVILYFHWIEIVRFGKTFNGMDNEILKTRIWDMNVRAFVINPVFLALLFTILYSSERKNLVGNFFTNDMFSYIRNNSLFEDSCRDYLKRAKFDEAILDKIVNFCSMTILHQQPFLKKELKTLKKYITDFFFTPNNEKKACDCKIRIYTLVKKAKNQTEMNKLAKFNCNCGKIVSFVGLDGAGKSTTANLINIWLSKEFETQFYYMGEGNGHTPFIVNVLKRLTGRTGKSTIVRGWLCSLCNSLIFLFVSINNLKNMRKFVKQKKYGVICITDRYPQKESPDMNNGPKIGKYVSEYPESLLFKFLQKAELRNISKVSDIIPDLIIRLNVTVPTSMKRHPEQTNPGYFQYKLDALNRITFNNAEIVDINSEQEYENEMIEVKKAIWKALTSNNFT